MGENRQADNRWLAASSNMRVAVLDIDGLQPAYLGPYGCEWLETPTLDRWAAEGIVFDQHFCDCPDPSTVPGWRTARHPLGPQTFKTDLFDELTASGVRVAHVGPAQTTNDRLIDVVCPRLESEPLSLKPTIRGIRHAIDQIGDATDALLWIEVDALLPPWRPSDEALADVFGESDSDEKEEDQESPWLEALAERIDPNDDQSFARLQRTYGAGVVTLDASLDRLLRDCAKRGWGKDVAWALTSRRGFPLGEHGPVGFEVAGLNEELVHVPLIIRLPSGDQAGMRVGALTQPTDFGATLREWFELRPIPVTDEWSGRSVSPLVCGEASSIRDRAITGWRCPGQTLWGIRTPREYLLINGEAQLFIKPSDRWEVNNVQSHYQELSEELEREFRATSNAR